MHWKNKFSNTVVEAVWQAETYVQDVTNGQRKVGLHINIRQWIEVHFKEGALDSNIENLI